MSLCGDQYCSSLALLIQCSPDMMHHYLLFILLCASTLILTTAATTNDNLRFFLFNYCPDKTNYTRGSAFQANLNALLSSLPDSAAASSGFATNTTGAAPDQAFGLAQCRGDISASDCSACLSDSASEMASKCPGKKSAPGLFAASLDTLMHGLAEEAYGSPRMFAAGSVNLTAYEKIYGMAQCTRDLRREDCSFCLANAVRMLPRYCPGRKGGRFFYWSCSVRFEMGPFYDDDHAAEPSMTSAPAPGGVPLNGSDHNVPGTSTGSSRTVRSTTLLISIPVAVTLLLVLLLVAVYICKKNRKPNKHVEVARDRFGDDEEMKSSGPVQYDLSTLQAATENFSEENKLRQGGFGPVYKGTLENGQEIAVNRLSEISKQGLGEMKNEIVLVAKLQHKDLVRLLGFCMEKKRSSSSTSPARQQELSWGQRKKIIEGIGKGLTYLHEDSRLTVIHRDLKADNILLDVDMNPKISDFGLAKLFSINASVANTDRIAGTLGYMAPEYAQHGIFSAKSDVYSYGVLVLEIITVRRVHENLLKFVWRHWSLGSVTQLLDGYPADEPGKQDMLRCIHTGLLCVQEDPQLRPSMASVLLMLKHRIMTMSAPTKPAFVFLSSDTPRVAVREPSINVVSVSDLEPR
ncbi:hypothetical protein HU200_024111 [Digitaria exilis]|uniref:Uncharacterized protein n=1 Tax=Digitaria exilis TaxID=1010633 RepID=A0A835ET98_9POAL|nr:hypothetical protein HU200_024111 [Digitaria exilis]